MREGYSLKALDEGNERNRLILNSQLSKETGLPVTVLRVRRGADDSFHDRFRCTVDGYDRSIASFTAPLRHHTRHRAPLASLKVRYRFVGSNGEYHSDTPTNSNPSKLNRSARRESI